jgi:glycosyltransferase involved in cell wall biosynthesis
MRIAMVACNAPARTAVGNLLAEKVAFFVDRGAEVQVFLESTTPLHPQLLDYAQRCPELPVVGPAWEYLAQSDIVFFEFSQGFELLSLLPLLVDEKPRLIVTYYGISPSDGWPGPQRALLERGCRDRGLLWCADAVIVHSRFTAEELVRATNLPRDRIHQLKVPLDLARWQSSNPGVRVLPNPGGRPGNKDSRPILLFVGRLALNKRLPLVIEALAHLPDAEAWIAGNDRDIYAEQARASRDLADRLGVADRVRWLGDVADDALPALYRQADALVFPSVHEGLGIPALEAQAAGLPVVAARVAALPETIADAGLTFRADDVADFVRQIRRVIPSKPSRENSVARPSRPKKRIALVAFRFGGGFIGGAETSLRNLGRALQGQGYTVEVFTTCTIRESNWKNDLPAGNTIDDGFLIHRFPIDAHDRPRHDDAFRAILDHNGDVAPAIEADYLAHSIQSTSLLTALKRQFDDYDALITGPYLHGLTFRVAQAFPEKTLLLPCFHDEPVARLRAWLDVYGAVAGILYHTPEEQDFAQAMLGLNHPGATLIGAHLPLRRLPRRTGGEGGEGVDDGFLTLVYCGRYSVQKNLPLLLDFARRYESLQPGRVRWVFIGEGNARLPAEPWLRDAGRVGEEEKHRILARADALVQLSTQESLSLVVLEAWQHAKPVIVHAEAAVLVGQVTRSGGGVAIGDFESFARALDDLWANPETWQDRGHRGRQFVEDNYADADVFARRLVQAIEDMSIPLAEQMRRRGFQRVQAWDRPAWREQFGQFVERLLDAPPRRPRRHLLLEPLLSSIRVAERQASFLLPVRIHNRGNLPATTGRAATRIEMTLREMNDEPMQSRSVDLVDMILPGRTATVMAPIALPRRRGQFELALQIGGAAAVTLPVEIGNGLDCSVLAGGIAPLLEAAQVALAEAHARQALPRDYLDVCEGRFARVKRWLKQKLLNNFKRAYVDVLSVQQSEVNRRLVESVQQLTECCRALDQTVRALQEQVTEARQVDEPASRETEQNANAREPVNWS